MGRRPEGYRLRKPRPGAAWCVRFRIDGVRREVSTGERDRGAAERAARTLYADALRGVAPRQGGPARRFQFTAEVAASWLTSLALRPRTLGSYEEFSGRWLREVRSWDSAGLQAHVRKRLREARAKTVRSEVSALRGLLRWLVEVGELQELPELPRVPTSALGTPCGVRRRVAAPDLSRAEVRRFLAALPEKSDKGWWVRPRCELLYETGLRPSTVDALSVPEHWQSGSDTLRITSEIDKEGFAREVPLTARARAVLEACAPPSGAIFGPHKYWRYIQPAAKATLPAGKAAVFTGQHLRSARATGLLDAGASLTGVQFLLGHRRASTTARYVRPSLKAARAALKRAG